MTSEIHLVFCALVVLTGASRAEVETTARPPVLTSTVPLGHEGSPATPDPTGKDPRHEAGQRKHNPADWNGTSAGITTTSDRGEVLTETGTSGASAAYVQRETVSVFTPAPTDSVSPADAAHGLSSDPTAPTLAASLQRGPTTEGGPLLTGQTLATFSSQPPHTDDDASPTVTASTSTTQLKPVTTGTTPTLAPGWGPAGPTHREVPSELNVGDEELKRPRSSSPLDPLLAGLLSVFIVTTAIVFVVLFLKFRHRTNHPEFHRLQDLPMDDLMEDTPLSRYSY